MYKYLLAIGLIAVLTGCGLKGDLELPQEDNHQLSS